MSPRPRAQARLDERVVLVGEVVDRVRGPWRTQPSTGAGAHEFIGGAEPVAPRAWAARPERRVARSTDQNRLVLRGGTRAASSRGAKSASPRTLCPPPSRRPVENEAARIATDCMSVPRRREGDCVVLDRAALPRGVTVALRNTGRQGHDAPRGGIKRAVTLSTCCIDPDRSRGSSSWKAGTTGRCFVISPRSS